VRRGSGDRPRRQAAPVAQEQGWNQLAPGKQESFRRIGFMKKVF
jgi:hypothetical protein